MKSQPCTPHKIQACPCAPCSAPWRGRGGQAAAGAGRGAGVEGGGGGGAARALACVMPQWAWACWQAVCTTWSPCPPLPHLTQRTRLWPAESWQSGVAAHASPPGWQGGAFVSTADPARHRPPQLQVLWPHVHHPSGGLGCSILPLQLCPSDPAACEWHAWRLHTRHAIREGRVARQGGSCCTQGHRPATPSLSGARTNPSMRTG